MQSQVVFLTFFLGLVVGQQPVDVKVGPAVAFVRILLGDQTVATLDAPPWRAMVNFAKELTPRPLTVVAFDSAGNEVGRDTQVLNLPRPAAAVEIVLQYDDHHTPVGAELRWRNLENSPVKHATLMLDDFPVPLSRQYQAKLPAIDMTHPHSLAAEFRFADDVVARREIVFGGHWSEMQPAELTPVLVKQVTKSPAAKIEGCFAANGETLRTASIEKPGALVLIVRNPDATEAMRMIDPAAMSRRGGSEKDRMRRFGALDPGTHVRFLWPNTVSFPAPGQPTSELFVPSGDFSSSEAGIPWLLTNLIGNAKRGNGYRWADAVAVAGVKSISYPRRRAVVLVLGRDVTDASRHTPAVVRRYLRMIGTPLFVWSLTGPRPELEELWGNIDDVSSRERLLSAIDRVRAAIAEQRIAWVQTDRLTAMKLRETANCGYEPAAEGDG